MDISAWCGPQLGEYHTVTCTVTAANTALAMSSGSLEVFATPAMVALMEQAAAELLGRTLPNGMASVGTELNIQHLMPSPVGIVVTATATVLAVKGRQVEFEVTAQTTAGTIGKGTHTRAVVQAVPFIERANTQLVENKGE